MLEHCLYPKSLQPQELDEFLAKGWFRMGQSIFTTYYVLFYDKLYQTIWLRHQLKNYTETKTISILKKRNKAFRVELKQVCITPSHELLFELYKESVYFNAASSLHDLLYGYVFEAANIYNTYEINLYDGNMLIGCSYFDIGHKSAEGISSYYHPEYKKHSLGKYLIYLQLEICKHNGFELYYPGYFVPGFAHLDYKLAIGTEWLEFLNPETMQWQNITEYTDKGIPLDFQSYFIDE